MVMAQFIKCVGDIDIRQVQHQHGERFIRARLDKDNAPATVAKKIRHLKRLFQLAVDRTNWKSIRCADSSSPGLRNAKCVCSPTKSVGGWFLRQSSMSKKAVIACRGPF